MKTVKKLFRLVKIDSLVYVMRTEDLAKLPEIPFDIAKENLSDGKISYTIFDQGTLVHRSFLFPKVHMMSLLHKKGLVIGDCFTDPSYRGKSIYPYVINSIAKEKLDSGQKEVFIIVSPDNIPSIRGIEKAGFKLLSRVQAKRFLVFYFGTKIGV